MTPSRQRIIYIHGFNSSPASEKARQFSDFCQRSGHFDLAVPALAHDPKVALAQLEALIEEAPGKPYLLVGSSLGGYYATWLAEQHDCRAVLVNPAVSPVKHLGEEFLGWQKNLYSGEEYEFTRDFACFLDTLDIASPTAGNYLVLLQTGDEVLDYRLAVSRYAGAEQVVQEGGSHRFEHFNEMIPAMLEFAETGRLSDSTRKSINTMR